MFCNQCGTQNPDNAKFCSDCGLRFVNNEPSVNLQKYDNQYPTSNKNPVDSYFSLFVGEKYYSYYRDVWFSGREPNLNQRGARILSFSLPGLLCGIGWMCYRRCYFYAFTLIMILTLVDIITMHISTPLEYTSFDSFKVTLIMLVITCTQGNYLYFVYSAKKINKILKSTDDEYTRRQMLSKQGGTSGWGAFGMTLLFVILTISMYALFAPRWAFL